MGHLNEEVRERKVGNNRISIIKLIMSRTYRKNRGHQVCKKGNSGIRENQIQGEYQESMKEH